MGISHFGFEFLSDPDIMMGAVAPTPPTSEEGVESYFEL